MNKIVLFMGGVETQGFFSKQMEGTFVSLGYDVFMFDYDREAASSYELLRFYEKGNTVMVTFNFHGICNEDLLRDDNDVYIWEELKIPCINIVVDHPFYYDRFMPQLPKYYSQISIDENHEDYMRRFYSHVKLGPFLPLGGTQLDESIYPRIPIRDRETEVVFTGSWAEPEFFGQYMENEGPEYAAFYRSVLTEQLDNPDKTFEEIFEPRIRQEAEEGDEITDDMLRDAYANLINFDMYVRYFFRGELIRILVDSGVKVKCIGGGWDKLNCRHPENLTHVEYSSSLECLEEIANAKISINVMPWFKRGAHDRIFNSMLNGAVCFTDSSQYLDEILLDGQNCIMFSLDKIEEAADIIKQYIGDDEKLQEIADAGYYLAQQHTWDERARRIAEYLESDLFREQFKIMQEIP